MNRISNRFLHTSTLLVVSILLSDLVTVSALKLESYNVDPKSITVSGLSSGGMMATQYHIAFSSEVHGCGVLAGCPFGCAKHFGIEGCTLTPESIELGDLIGYMNNLFSIGGIDNPSNIKGDRVYIFHGTLDHRVLPLAGHKVADMYQQLGAELKTKLDLKAAHGFPTDSYGGDCDVYSPETEFINNCSFNTAFETLNYLYNGTLAFPLADVRLTKLIEFDQEEFGGNVNVSMSSVGFLYVPSGCADKSKECKFHISIHGCRQHRHVIGEIYASKTGYIEVAETNDIIILFPQTAPNEDLENAPGCWDWYGYLTQDYLTKEGPQMKAINRMVKRAALCDGEAGCYQNSSQSTFRMLIYLMLLSVLLTSLFRRQS